MWLPFALCVACVCVSSSLPAHLQLHVLALCLRLSILLSLCTSACSQWSRLPKDLAAHTRDRWDMKQGQAGSWSSLISLQLWTVDLSVLIPVCVSCPQHAEAPECTAPVCYSSASTVSKWLPGPPTRPDMAQEAGWAPHDSGSVIRLLILFKY